MASISDGESVVAVSLLPSFAGSGSCLFVCKQLLRVQDYAQHVDHRCRRDKVDGEFAPTAVGDKYSPHQCNPAERQVEHQLGESVGEVFHV